MPRVRVYASHAAKQAAYRQRRDAHLLQTTPQMQIGDCILYQGDALRVQAALGPVDHVLTDPPYGTHATHATHLFHGDAAHREDPASAGL